MAFDVSLVPVMQTAQTPRRFTLRREHHILSAIAINNTDSRDIDGAAEVAMTIRFSPCLTIIFLAACACANGGDQAEALAENDDVISAREETLNETVHTGRKASDDMTPIENLPYARGNAFSTLDEYLAYLEKYNGPIDLPYWRRIGPDTFEFATTMTDRERETATRAELMERYGFAQ